MLALKLGLALELALGLGSLFPLHRIHKTTLDAVEDNDAKHEEDTHEGETVA